MPRKARAGGTGGSYTIILDKTRSATSGELWRCRMTGFKAPFFGATPRAACLQVGQAVESHIEQRLAVGTATTGSKGRKTPMRTKARTRRTQQQLAESIL